LALFSIWWDSSGGSRRRALGARIGPDQTITGYPIPEGGMVWRGVAATATEIWFTKGTGQIWRFVPTK
jgi:hypothetical protein